MPEDIFVTRPAMPPLPEFTEMLERIWQSRILTNNGSLHIELEEALRDYLGVPYLSLFSNGTLALITAMKVMDVSGEVITTPFSFVATAHSIAWNGSKPVFVDIEPEYCNIDPEKIEAAITPSTSAIVPVHVYGNPCNDEQIRSIARKHNLKVIYDAAHAFGVHKGAASVAGWGDLSILSFHATKVYSTLEGGAIICHDRKTKQRIDDLRNFGFRDEVTVAGLGINAKMNEVQAAYGLITLKHVDEGIRRRQEHMAKYRSLLADIPGVRTLPLAQDVTGVCAYFPIFIDEIQYGKTRDSLYQTLKDNRIFARRYFYPLISNFSYYNGLESASSSNLAVANKIANEVLCLPLYADLSNEQIEMIAGMIRSSGRKCRL